jgi:single-strand DNA-binding protein
MLNKVQIIGRLGKPVEMKYSQTGNPIALFTVATDESYVDKNGQKQSATEWHRIVTYGKQAETCSQYLDKGSLVYVEGRLRTRKWQDSNGQDRFSTEINADRVQFLDRKPEPASWATAPYTPPPAPPKASPSDMGDLPF